MDQKPYPWGSKHLYSLLRKIPCLPPSLDSFVIESLDSKTSTTTSTKIFSILSSARARTSVILAGKRGSRRHSTTSFRENVVAAETSYQMLEVLPFCDRERVYPPSLKVTVLNFLVKNGKMKVSGQSIF